MRIGLNGRFYGKRVTGVQRFAHEVSTRLFERGAVTLFLPAGCPRPEEVPPHVPVVWGRLAGHAWEQLELPWHIRAERCDAVLHLSGTAPGWGGPHVVVVYDLTPLTHPGWYTRPFRAWFRLAMGRSAQHASGVVAISEWTRSEVERVLAIPRSRVRVVPQGLDPFTAPATAEEVRRVRRQWDLPERYLLALGGGNPRKNVAFLVEMLGRWKERYGESPHLVLAGQEFSHLHAQARMGAESRADVHLVGHVSDRDLQALYTGAAAFCFPSLAEGFGRPPLEAMACGTPAVVANYGCAAEVLGSAARILPLDIDRWIDAIAPLLAGDGVREQWAQRGRERTARYRWESTVDELVGVCRAVAGRAEGE